MAADRTSKCFVVFDAGVLRVHVAFRILAVFVRVHFTRKFCRIGPHDNVTILPADVNVANYIIRDAAPEVNSVASVSFSDSFNEVPIRRFFLVAPLRQSAIKT